MMRGAMLLCFLVAVCAGAAFARADDLPRYAIQARIDLANHKITAAEQVTFTNNLDRPTREVYFHIYPNRAYTPSERSFITRYASYFNVDPFPQGFEQTAVNISRMESEGRPLDFHIEGRDKTLVKVVLPKPLTRGQSVTVDLDFSVGIPVSYGRYGTINGITALARWYPILSVYEQGGWENHPFYPFHRPFHSEAAYYNVDLTVPADEVVAHTGNVTGQEDRAGGEKTLHIQSSGPVREFSLALSNTYKMVEEEHQGVLFKAFYLPGHEDRAHEAIADAADLMEDYTRQFGAYPYKTFSIVPVHLGYGGEQMSNMIFIDTRVFDLPKILDRYFDFMIAHETGHQWFYNLVGLNDYSEMWLEEGMNSYFLLLHLEAKYGQNAQIIDWQKLPRWARRIKILAPELTFEHANDVRYKMATRFGFERPIMSPLYSFNEPSNIFTLTYGKGSRVVGMLRTIVGEDNFARIFKRIFKEYRYRNLTFKDFERICNEESGQDLTWFFQEWLFTTAKWDARIDAVRGNRIYVSRRAGIVMPVDVAVTGKDGSRETLHWDGKDEHAVLTAHHGVRRAVIDPEHKLLDIDRVNNSWPRKINFEPVLLYHPLYDIPSLMPEDGYNLIVGPEISNGIGIKSSWQKAYDYTMTAATDYDFGNQIQRSRLGAEVFNILHTQTTFGVEEMVQKDYDNGEDDLVTDKVFLRRELWPAPYNLTDVNDHITFYALRNRTPSEGSWLQSERLRNTSYLKRNESIVGTMLHFDRSRPRPDPQAGYSIDTLVENSGHWAGATQTFTRASIDWQTYHPVTAQSKMAYRIKYGWGSSDDKNLYELGGPDGLRGYRRKNIRGANVLLGQVEYRFPLLTGLDVSVADHTLTLTKISAAAFFDGGQAWYGSFGQAKFRKDAGLGLRLHLTAGGFLEDALVRLDVAQAINDPHNDPHVWLGINQAF